MQAQLEADYKRDGVHVFSDSDFQAWSEHLAWIRLGLDSPDVLADPANLATFIVLGHDASVSHLFIEKLSPRDVKTEALKNLIHLAQANADRFARVCRARRGLQPRVGPAVPRLVAAPAG